MNPDPVPRKERVRISLPGFAGLIVQTDDGSRTLQHPVHGETYHSESGALAESRTVFLHNSGVAGRLGQSLPTRVLEIGFGTGLNFWLTATRALEHGSPLEFVSVESDLLPLSVLDALGFCELPGCRTAYELFRPALDVAGNSCPHHYEAQRSGVGLKLLLEDALVGSWRQSGPFDAIYLDAFSPDSNPDLWSGEFLGELADCLDRGHGRLVTYCVKSSIQKLLRAAGLKVNKTPGPAGGKREVLVASWSE